MSEQVFEIRSEGTPETTVVLVDGVKLERVFGVEIDPIFSGGDYVTATVKIFVNKLDIKTKECEVIGYET